MAVHGDIQEITFNHPTLGSGTFFPKAAEGNTFDPGGLRNSDDANSITGGGSLMIQKNRVRGFFEVVIENDMNIRNDANVIKELSASPLPAEWTLSHINGTVWSGNGVVVGDITPDMNAGTLTLKVVFAEFKKIIG